MQNTMTLPGIHGKGQRILFAIDWRNMVWLLLVALTLGLSSLAWKRPANEAVVKPCVTVGRVSVAAMTPERKRMIVQVRQVKQLPVWSSGMLDADLMIDEYPRARV